MPLQNEKPFDYWIRLHNAIIIAAEGLKRQGKTLNDPFREVTLMLIRNCPDPELSLIFTCKPLHEWTAADVQVRLDEYQREDKFQQRKSNAYVSGIACHAQSTGVFCAHSRGLEIAAAGVPPFQMTEQSTQDQTLSRVISLLERVFDQGSCQQTARVFRPQNKGRSAVSKQNAACEICGDASHDTFSHG